MKQIVCPKCGFKGINVSTMKQQRPYTNLIQFDSKGYPKCEKHGAMNCVKKDGLLWRCLTCGVGISFNNQEHLDAWLKTHNNLNR